MYSGKQFIIEFKYRWKKTYDITSYFVFRSVIMFEEGGEDLFNEVLEEENDDELEGDRNRYTVPTRSREKIKYDVNRFRK